MLVSMGLFSNILNLVKIIVVCYNLLDGRKKDCDLVDKRL